LLLLTAVGGYVLYPIGSLLAESVRGPEGVSFRHYASVLDPSAAGNREAIINSVVVSLLSVVGSGIIGTLLAFVLTQVRFPLRRVAEAVAVLPVALPPLVGVLAFLFVFGESGVIPRSLGLLFGVSPSLFAIDGIPAIVVVHMYSFSVYFMLMGADALRRIDGSLLEAGASLGAGTLTVFRRVLLPHLRPALVGASLLTFMASMASFSAPLLYAGAHRFMTLQIYTSKLNGELDLAAAHSAVLAAISIGFFIVLGFLQRRAAGGDRTRGAPRRALMDLPRWVTGTLLACGGAILVFDLLPVIALALISFAREGSWTWQILPGAYTLDNYRALFDDPAVFLPVGNSLVMTLLAVCGAVIIGVPAALLTARLGGRSLRMAGDLFFTFPYALPGTVVAIGLLLAFSRPTIMTGGAVLVGTFWILPLAYVVRTYPLVIRSTAASLALVDPSLGEAAASMGAGGVRTFVRVTALLVLPGVVSGAVLVAVAAVGEFVSSILLYTYASRPVAVEILAQVRSMNFGAAGAYSVLLLGVILAIVGVGGWITRRGLGDNLPPG
jgi:iron(III) transport system permease protein